MNVGEWIIRKLRLIEPKDRLVKIKSWRIGWDSRYRCPTWPTYLVDRHGGGRYTSTPLWDRARWRHVFRLPMPATF